MTIPAGALLDIDAGPPVAGGRMLARHDGQVVLVAGAIPGERVRVRVTRVQKHLAWADAIEVLEASPDRRVPICEARCGGSSYAHIAYPRQLQLKAEIVADAFRRIAKRPLDGPLDVASSPERGYRLRARLHVHGDRVGFLLEGSHTVCDAGPTGQLHEDAVAAVEALRSALGPSLASLQAVVVAESVAGGQRILHLEPRPREAAGDGPRWPARRLVRDALAAIPGVNGISVATPAGSEVWHGEEYVGDEAATLFASSAGVPADIVVRRRAASFFQGNRFLINTLTSHVFDAARGRPFADLYAGVGLFSVMLAAAGAAGVAIEGDESSSEDLSRNAEPFEDRLMTSGASVEGFLQNAPRRDIDVVVLDPPRTGASPAALAGLVAWQRPRVVYVSCDPPTMARDAARLFAAGYELTSIAGLDLFPQTPHVECVAVFDLPPSREATADRRSLGGGG